jgi:predicted O-linked N-acetylglucosamine transferase (SPINDLY family)
VTELPEGYYAVAAPPCDAAEELRALKAHLEAVRFTCPLFDSPTYTRDLERLYEQAVVDGAASR